MPDLPTITVTDAQATRILNAFGDAATYRAWLRQSVRDYVLSKEATAIRAEQQAKMDAAVAAINTELGSI